MDTTLLLYIASALLIIIGLAGTVLPALPGLPIVFAGMLLAAWTGDFATISVWTIVFLGVLTAIALALDFIAGLLGAKRVGASGLALAGAAVGTIVGLFFGLPGLILGPFVGAVLGELIHSQHAGTAARVGVATWLGMVFGALMKLALAFVMLGVFALALLF
jgi:uncharacterized protein YqgC (DUF456 family)